MEQEEGEPALEFLKRWSNHVDLVYADQTDQTRTMPMSQMPGTMSSMSQVQLTVAPAKVLSKWTASQ
uniref:Uncharacterized protein n=1 Tax=Romanomermis culicivorax TaxID=13658 RepID=A0A915JI44_ROMCU